MSNSLKAILAVTVAAIGAYCGQIIVPVVVLLAVMILDYLSGLAAAWVHNELSSRVGIIGIVKKVAYLLTVAVAFVVDYVINLTAAQLGHEVSFCFFGLLVVVWLILNECISILENVDKIGGPVPSFLKKIIERLKQTTEKKAEEPGGGAT